MRTTPRLPTATTVCNVALAETEKLAGPMERA